MTPQSETRALREALEVQIGIRPKPCGHPFDCICHGDHIKKLLATPASREGWRPISEAPNSLSQILVTDGVSIWIDQKIGVRSDDAEGDHYFNGHEEWRDVTHWQPLPAAPDVEGGR